MAHSSTIEVTTRAVEDVSRAFAVVRDSGEGAAARAASQVRTSGTRQFEVENRDPDDTAEAVVVCHHSSFEHALNGIVGDIRGLAPVVVVTGEAGTGKTMLVRRAMCNLGQDVIPVLQRDACATFKEFLGSACQNLSLANAQFGEVLRPEDRFQVFWDRLLAQHARGRSLVVFADDAQEMSEALLGQLALLSKWTKSGKHVLQLVLAGRPGLEILVHRLVDRELIREDYPIHRLTPLKPDEIHTFITLQLSAFGDEATQLVLPEAADKIAAYSQGIPRLILTLFKLAVFKARLEGRSAVTPDLVDQVAQSVIDGQALDDAEPEVAGGSQPASLERPRQAPVSCSIPDQEKSQMTRLENLNKILKNLQTQSPGIEASALISEDGLMIASALSSDMDDTRVGGMTATLLNLGTRAATELRRGDVKEVIVRGDEGYAVMVSAGRGVLLLVLASEDTKLGLIFFDMREAIKDINKIL
jgi:predicted regulator of Ras-like GTPase activity (Roadblock/LC7/MglB family)/type II secretory pathway predicted ATPase ExeA